MKVEKLEDLSLQELAALICENLKKEGLKTTLSGGACAEIYSGAKYVTGDLDFVVNYLWPENEKKIDKVMVALGFKRKGRIFVTSLIPYSVEFPPGPLSIGEDYRVVPTEITLKTGHLSLLSPTDSIKDRLTGYFYGNDAQCLQQAIMIFQMNDADIQAIREWAKIENKPDKYAEFEKSVLESHSR